ncbi:hypothetical protein BXZ70DRAFT_1010297 [Cristinia sonorae]|uniref:Uncharacterized protein n=1 Tax=Cristinia sonorae TaxID=1940300 RepID=A0A8K0XN04_9AGAR|nr:hypothetical protein BXZ70DRAFT_1010297 [Cristinia sonorae]
MDTLQNAFTRALSPVTQGLSAIAEASASAERQGIARFNALADTVSAATSLAGVISACPTDYRSDLEPALKGLETGFEKLFKARQLLVSYEKHKASGTLPSFLRLKEPAVQFSKDYMDGQYLRSTLDALIAGKKDEIGHMERELSSDKCPPRTARPDGQLITVDFFLIPAKQELHDTMKNASGLFRGQVEVIVEMRERAASLKFEKKKALQKDADVEMADATRSSSSSLQSLVDKAVSAKVKSLEKKVVKNAIAGSSKGAARGAKPVAKRPSPVNPVKQRQAALEQVKNVVKKNKKRQAREEAKRLKGGQGKGKGKAKAK